MKIHYHSKASNGATFRFSSSDEAAAMETLAKILSLGMLTRKPRYSEVRATERGAGTIDEAIASVGAEDVNATPKTTGS